jgi:hypothetical protein
MVSLEQLVTPPKKLVVHETRVLVTEPKKPEHAIVTEPNNLIVSRHKLIVLKTKNNIKMGKQENKYVVVTKKRTYEYRSVTWADKKFNRLSEIFERDE